MFIIKNIEIQIMSVCFIYKSNFKFKKSRLFFFLFVIITGLSSCNSKKSQSDSLHIIHAGSFSMVIKEAVKEYNKISPDVQIITEAWGSKDGARQITELKKPCDIFISADNKIIENLLIPDYASWSIPFAGNEIVLAYTEKSKYSAAINAENWFEILSKRDVLTARSSPDSDPCGVRAVIMLKLADIYYNKEISGSLIKKDQNFMRPKESDLIAMLEEQTVDYLYIYKSIAVQHSFKYIQLPEKINLSNPDLANFYSQVSLSTRGKTPQTNYLEKGTAIVYGLTIPKTSENPEAAVDFISFLLSDSLGGKLLQKSGQNILPPQKVDDYNKIPKQLQKFVLR